MSYLLASVTGMARRSDPVRVARAQLAGSRQRLVDLDCRRDLDVEELARLKAETNERIAALVEHLHMLNRKDV
jgi:hypothetical protein